MRPTRSWHALMAGALQLDDALRPSNRDGAAIVAGTCDGAAGS
eukprot:COSAG01_NODE_26662_length_707_cov_0.516447_1_plen_42_part_10